MYQQVSYLWGRIVYAGKKKGEENMGERFLEKNTVVHLRWSQRGGERGA